MLAQELPESVVDGFDLAEGAEALGDAALVGEHNALEGALQAILAR